MAQAYSRVTQGPGVCMAACGPATLNFGTGLANALIDCCPVVAVGGSSPISQFGRQVFQEIDQVEALKAASNTPTASTTQSASRSRSISPSRRR